MRRKEKQQRVALTKAEALKLVRNLAWEAKEAAKETGNPAAGGAITKGLVARIEELSSQELRDLLATSIGFAASIWSHLDDRDEGLNVGQYL